jgi:protein tyrosine/serine phosphatase
MRKLAPLLFAVLAACGAKAQDAATSTSTGKAFARRMQGVENLAQINPSLYRGAQPDAAGFRALKEMGVKTVISFRSYHTEKKDVEAAGMTAIQIPVQADVFGSTPPTDEQIKLFFTTCLDPAKQPVFFHCAHGKDRTGTLGALWRIEVDGWTNAEAIEEMQAFGYHDIYKDLIAFVKEYKPRGFKK